MKTLLFLALLALLLLAGCGGPATTTQSWTQTATASCTGFMRRGDGDSRHATSAGRQYAVGGGAAGGRVGVLRGAGAGRRAVRGER